MTKQIILWVLVFHALMTNIAMEYCNIPKECHLVSREQNHRDTDDKRLICSVTSDSLLRFNHSLTKQINSEKCEQFDINIITEFTIRPKNELSLQLKRGMIDLENLIDFISYTFLYFQLRFFKGFDLNLFDDSFDTLNYNNLQIVVHFDFSSFDFYLEDKKLNSCQDIIEATNSTNPRSIFQVLTQINNQEIEILLAESKSRICPLVFKNFKNLKLTLFGEDSFYSKRVLSFSDETFPDLNSSVSEIHIYVDNIDLDTNSLHPDVFGKLRRIVTMKKIRRIQPDLFIELKNVSQIYINNYYVKSIMHRNGIEWIKNYNKQCDINMISTCDGGPKFIFLKCFNFIHSAPLEDIFPEEDFCLYKDFPTNQLVFILENCDIKEKIEMWNKKKDKITCTYLWITRLYELLIKRLKNSTVGYKIVNMLLNSDEYKSISKCNFESKLELCNKWSFQTESISTLFELGEAMTMTQSVINIFSYILSIFGLVTNLLIIIIISSKKNEKNFKGFKQYDYLRLNSICNCFILLIHLISWLNHCIYPFQVFCPLIRKTRFMQYFNIIIEEILMNTLKFMNNFTYIGFAFNRISLIGKDTISW